VVTAALWRQAKDVHDAVRLLQHAAHACTLLANQQAQVSSPASGVLPPSLLTRAQLLAATSYAS
jgi:hypothetical protein